MDCCVCVWLLEVTITLRYNVGLSHCNQRSPYRESIIFTFSRSILYRLGCCAECCLGIPLEALLVTFSCAGLQVMMLLWDVVLLPFVSIIPKIAFLFLDEWISFLL